LACLHGAPARSFLARSVYRSNFLFCCAVLVRATRFRQWRSERVCPREIVCCKANGNDRETEEEPLIVFGCGRAPNLIGSKLDQACGSNATRKRRKIGTWECVLCAQRRFSTLWVQRVSNPLGAQTASLCSG